MKIKITLDYADGESKPLTNGFVDFNMLGSFEFKPVGVIWSPLGCMTVEGWGGFLLEERGTIPQYYFTENRPGKFSVEFQE